MSYSAAINIAITIHLAGKCKSALMRKQFMLLPLQCAVVFCVKIKCQYGCCIACSQVLFCRKCFRAVFSCRCQPVSDKNTYSFVFAMTFTGTLAQTAWNNDDGINSVLELL